MVHAMTLPFGLRISHPAVPDRRNEKPSFFICGSFRLHALFNESVDRGSRQPRPVTSGILDRPRPITETNGPGRGEEPNPSYSPPAVSVRLDALLGFLLGFLMPFLPKPDLPIL